MKENHSGIILDLSKLPHLALALEKAESTAPQSIHNELGRKSPSQIPIVLLHDNEMALADKKSCRLISAVHTSACHAIFLRNPRSGKTVAAHLAPDSEGNSLIENIRRIAHKGDKLDMYIAGGESIVDGYSEGSWQSAVKHLNKTPETAQELEEDLQRIAALAHEMQLAITPKVINLYNAKATSNPTIDTVNGKFFYLSEDAVAPLIPAEAADRPFPDERPPVIMKFDGLQKRREA